MRILFDQGTPLPLRRVLTSHTTASVFERGWSTLTNGQLLDAAESAFEVLITTDRDIRYQQNLAGRRLAILVLPTTSWPRIERHTEEVEGALASIRSGEYRELIWED